MPPPPAAASQTPPAPKAGAFSAVQGSGHGSRAALGRPEYPHRAAPVSESLSAKIMLERHSGPLDALHSSSQPFQSVAVFAEAMPIGTFAARGATHHDVVRERPVAVFPEEVVQAEA